MCRASGLHVMLCDRPTKRRDDDGLGSISVHPQSEALQRRSGSEMGASESGPTGWGKKFR